MSQDSTEETGKMSQCYNCDCPSDSGNQNLSRRTICGYCGAWIAKLDQPLNTGDLYGEKYFIGEEYLNYELGQPTQILNFRRKIKILKRLLSSSQEVRLLEIGAATGDFLMAAQDAGWTVAVGVEVSEFARNIALEKGLDVYSPDDGRLDHVLKKLKPNVIVAWDVWEHLERPSEIFKHYLKYSTPDTLVSVTTVDSESKNAKKRQENWRQFHPPTHINYPSKRSLAYFFKNHSFDIQKHFYFGYYRPLAEYLAAAFGKKSWIKNSKLLFKVPVYLNLYDTQMIVARKGHKAI